MQRFGSLILPAIACSMAAWLAAAEHGSVDRPTATGADVTGIWRTASLTSAGRFGFTGSSSCAASSCHGSVTPDSNPDRAGRNELVLFFDHDPHRKSSRTLNSPASIAMFEALGVMLDGVVRQPQRERFNEVYQRCAACHHPGATTPGSEVESQPSSMVLGLGDGIGCETCHGPAERWLSRHFQRDFLALSASAKARYGMIDTGNLWVRARLCAQCHVGGPGRDVNHDFLAAGHPVLKFELAAYLDLLPKHWKDRKDRLDHGDPADFELRLWVVGQLASTALALEQLAARADDRQAVWPELAEYDCYACHHDLQAPYTWRQQRGFTHSQGNGTSAGAKKVMIPWNGWNHALLQAAGRQHAAANPTAGEFARSLTRLGSTMQNRFRPATADVRSQTAEALVHLQRWADSLLDASESVRVQPHEIRNMLVTIVRADEGRGAVATWDTATQLYLAFQALDQTQRYGKSADRLGPLDREIQRLLKEVRDELAFPRDGSGRYNSPKRFVGLLQADAPSSSRERVRRKFLRVCQLVQQR